MASAIHQKSSPERSHGTNDNSNGKNKQSLIENQQNRASEESAMILKHLTGNAEKFLPKFVNSLFKSRRFPRRYYINDNQTQLLIIQGDITRINVDAIVNAANEQMVGGSGVDGVIHRAAGPELRKACVAHKQIFPGVRLPSGHSRILLSYNMSSTTHYIINTAGPAYSSYQAEECAKDLSSCYRTALALANLYNLESIAFTAISCGVFGYPPNDGAEVALRTVDKAAESVPVVVFVLWDDHIYDAWVNKAEELGFTSLDDDSATATANPSKQLINDDKPKSTEKLPEENTYNPNVIDASSTVVTHKTLDPDDEDLLARLPSVPHDRSDTQQTVEMDEKNGTTVDNSQSNAQKPVDMADTNQEEKPTTIDGSKQQSVQETSDQSDDTTSKTKTIPGRRPNSIVSEYPLPETE